MPADYVEIKLREIAYYEGTKSLDGIPFKFRVYWNTYTENWYLSMTSLLDATMTIRGIALLPGKDLLSSHGYGSKLGELWLEDTSGAGENPTFVGMGDRWKLRYYPRD